MSANAQAVPQQAGSSLEVGHDTADRKTLLSRIRQQAEIFIAERLQDFQINVDDTLFELAGKTQDEDMHYLYLDTISRLRNQRQILKETFLSRFNELYKDALDHSNPDAICFVTDSAAIDKLLLNGNDDLECAVAIKNLAARVAEQQIASIQSIAGLYAELSGKQHNPLHPIVLCIAWKNAVDKTSLSVKARFIVYKLFAKFVLSELPTFYKTTLTQAAHLGIAARPLADNKPQAPAAASSQKPVKAQISKDFSVEQISRDLIMKRVVEILRDSAANGAPKETRTRGVIDALAILQEYQLNLTSTPTPGTEPASYLTGIFARLLHTARGDCPDQNDLDTVDLVNVLVDGIRGDAGLDERTRALVGTLRLPLLKLAYLDASFLTDPMHFGRRLLRGLLDAALTAAIGDNAERDRVFAMSGQIVERILLEFRHDVTSVEHIVEGTPLFTRDTGLLTKIADDTTATFELIEARFAQKMQKRAAPESVREFLATIWTGVMQKIRETKGMEDVAWQNALQCVDDLATLAAARPEIAQPQLLEAIPRLLCGLQNGLSLVNYDRKKKEQLFNQILSIHAREIQNTKAGKIPTKKISPLRTATA